MLTTRRDHERLAALLETQRVLYNAALAERRYAYRMAGKSLTFHEQHKALTEYRLA